jgi:(2R)-ethylmalonyl-CoA mutase
VQLPCWNEALGLPTPWDQQWSLRIQQVLAYESDLLEYGDLFDGSKVVEEKVAELRAAAQTELDWVIDGGGSFAMIDQMKSRLVQSHAERVRRIESGELAVVGVNAFTETETSPLAESAQRGGIVTIDPEIEHEHVEAIQKWRADRDQGAVDAARARLRAVAATTDNLVPATIELARAGGTVGEWAQTLRDVFGEYRAPTGVAGVAAPAGEEMHTVRGQVRLIAEATGGPIRLLVGKPGLDGHSNGAEQIAVAARDAGMEVIYQGIRLSPAEIAAAARDEDVDVVGLSILSGSHLTLVRETLERLRESGVDAPVVVGGIIPDADSVELQTMGVARVYTPKDFRLARIMGDIAELARVRRTASPQAGANTRR